MWSGCWLRLQHVSSHSTNLNGSLRAQLPVHPSLQKFVIETSLSLHSACVTYPSRCMLLLRSIHPLAVASLMLAACDPVDAPLEIDEAAEDDASAAVFGIGDVAPEVSAAHDYLYRYGYFPNVELTRTYPGWQPLIAEAPEDSEVFDDLLEAALLLFQAAHGLEETGLLDGATRSLMAQP